MFVFLGINLPECERSMRAKVIVVEGCQIDTIRVIEHGLPPVYRFGFALRGLNFLGGRRVAADVISVESKESSHRDNKAEKDCRRYESIVSRYVGYGNIHRSSSMYCTVIGLLHTTNIVRTVR